MKHLSLKLVALIALLAPGAAYAVDGVVLIDHAKALAGNVTPGDTPGYPITISQSGSYRLDGDLIVPDVNTDAIDIAASNVTIDLNGFSIIGSNVCTIRVTFGVSGLSCSPGGSTGKGIGINSPIGAAAVRNGTVRGMGGAGIAIFNGVIENVHAYSNGFIGISASGYAIVRNCTTDLNETGLGMSLGLAVSVAAWDNPRVGISAGAVRVIGSTISSNGTGLAGSSLTSFARSFFGGNATDLGSDGITPDLPVNAGENICSNLPCLGFPSMSVH